MAKKQSKSIGVETIQDWVSRQPKEDRPALRSNLSKLKKLYERQKPDDFTRLYDVGQLIRQLIPKGDRRYGENVIMLIAQDLEPDQKVEGPRNFLYQARDLADKLSRKEAVHLTKARMENGKRLSRSHVIALLAVEKSHQRQRLLERCLRQSWGVRRLRQEVQNARGRKQSKGGRKPETLKPQSAGVAVRNIALMSRDWMRNHEVWFEKSSCPFDQISKKDCSEAILRDARLAIAGLEQVQKATSYGLEQLKEFVEELEEMLSA